MDKIPADRLYTESHEWIRKEEDGTFTLGITQHAQELLGDIVHVIPDEGETELEAKAAAVTVESVKAVSDVYVPFACRILSHNSALENTPQLIETDPYDTGWILQLKPVDVDPKELDSLLDATDYAALCGRG
ncbi:MAG: glycine cleavage system protein GcvH [Kistimonas sp.]|nr:glycine cleavage system protein GcvH [Kistimonas sp.]